MASSHHQPSDDEPLSASSDLPTDTDPLMGNQHIKDESRSGDGVAFYTALVRRYLIIFPPRPPSDSRPHRSLGGRFGEQPRTSTTRLK